VAVGAAALFFTHTFINIGMTVKAAPIVGLPLPFISHGGSFMLCTMACAGLVQSVHVRRHDDNP
jgi:rod shape determining protein RodA